jgi:hypothetical protein
MIGSCTNSSVFCPPPYGSNVDGTSSSTWSPVASGATEGETQDAIDDSGDEGIVTSLSGAPAQSPTYNPTGLLNSFVQAGTPLADASSTGRYGSADDSGLAAAVQSDDGAVLSAEDASGAPGATAAGNYQSAWGDTLQTNPGMAVAVASDALDQGLVSMLSVMA